MNDWNDLTRVEKNALTDHLWPKRIWAEKKRSEVAKKKRDKRLENILERDSGVDTTATHGSRGSLRQLVEMSTQASERSIGMACDVARRHGEVERRREERKVECKVNQKRKGQNLFCF